MINFVTEITKIDFLGYFSNVNFQVKSAVATFGQHLEEFGQLFISASGHAGLTHSDKY